MVPEQIERETVIAAPVERVWALLTAAEHLGRWFGDAGAELDLRPGGATGLSWEQHGTVAGASSRRRGAAPSSATAGRPARVADGEPVRATRRSSSSSSRPRARDPAARRRERLRHALDVSGRRAGAQARRTTARAGTSELRELRGVRRSASPSEPDDRRRPRHGRSPPWPTPRAGACSPARRARRGHRDDAGRRAAGQPRGGRQAPRGPRPRRARRGPAPRPRGPLPRAARAPGAAARRMAELASQWDPRLDALKRLAEEERLAGR